MRPHLAIPSLLFLFAISFAQPATSTSAGVTFEPGASLRFEHLTIDNGLSQNAGLALLQDSQGYLWIGTQDGLNRYDGYNITQFRHDPEDPDSLSFNGVISLYEDRDRFLWIGTWGGGLNRYDPHTGKFSSYQVDSTPGSAIVTALTPDSTGGLWVGTLDGLAHFDPNSGTFTRYRSDSADPSTLSSNAISVVVPAEDGSLWIGTGGFSAPGAGLNRFDPLTGKAERISSPSQCLQSPNISDILPDPQGNLWIAYGGYGVTGGGIDRFNPKTGACAHYDNAKTFDNQITDNNITDLIIDRDGALWATSWSSGVWHMDPERPGEFIGIRHNPADPESLSNDNAFSILQDRTGVIWIGTLSAGINKLNPDTLQFHTYENDAYNPGSIASNHIGAFAETSDGTIWVGTWENGLARFDPAEGTFHHYLNNPADPKSLSSDLVMSLLADSDGTLWVGTLGGGLNHFDPQSGTFTRFVSDPGNPTSLIDNQVTFIARDSAARLWVGTMTGLSRLDPGASGFVNYPMETPPVALKVLGDELWIGTWGSGVSRLDLSQPASLEPTKATFFNMAHDPANPNSLSENSVLVIHQSPEGLLWFGTQGGLNRYNPKTGEFKIYTEKDGLRNATILGIMQDAAGSLWLTTNNGLAKFDSQSETFQIYDKSDGLQGNEFNSNAYFLSPTTGEMYVGGVSGFSVFNPLTLHKNDLPPSVVITNFSVFNTSQSFDPLADKPISLNYDQNFISFEFAALDFHAPQRNQYAYKLEGFDKDWVQAGTRRYARYTNLPGGEYTFRVKAANSDGVWNENGASLRLTVTPPFWQRWQFQLGLFIGALALVTTGFQWRVKSVRERNRRLEAMVNEQKRVENELRASEGRFRAMFDSSAMGTVVLDMKTLSVRLNERAAQILGHETREIQVNSAEELLRANYRDAELDLFRELLAGRRDTYQTERVYEYEGQPTSWAKVTFSTVQDISGELRYLVALIEDITEQKIAQDTLSESEARFKAMFDNAAVGVGVMSLDRQILQINQAAERLIGYTPEEIRAIDPVTLTVEEDRYIDREWFAELVAGKRDQYTVEKRYVRKNGTVFCGRVNFSAVHGTNGSPLYIVSIIEDVTEEKRAAERLAFQEAEHRRLLEQRIEERTRELNLANDRLREKAAQEAVIAERTRLARDLHDAVTQTLFSTTLIAEVLPDLWEINPTEGNRRLHELRQLTRGALAEMRTLLVELRPNALVEVPLPTLLRQLTEAMIGRSRINIQFSAEGERMLPPDVQIGLYRITQEALNNVVKHAKAQQAVVTLRLGRPVRLMIADDGAGFDLSTVTADHLGLKIMRERAEAIGAKLSIYSEPGEGTQISVVWESNP